MTRGVKAGLALFVLVLAGAAAGYAALYRLDVRPRLGFAPGFALVQASGAPLASDDLRGVITLYTFAPLNEAPGAARATTPVFEAVQAALASGDADTAAVPVRLVTIVLEPAPPERLQEAAAAAGADPARWTWATGSPEALRRTVRDGFGAYYAPAPDGNLRYDPTFVVVDGLGIVRAHYRLGVPAPEALLADLRALRREAAAAEGALGLAYEAAHLFRCYAPS